MRALVEEFPKQDAGLAALVPSVLPLELELRTLRTRKLPGFQRWLFGFGIGFTALGFNSKISL